MKKKVLTSLLASASVLGLCFSGTTALADVDLDGMGGESPASIGFKASDPGPGTEDLEIAFIPNSFNFGLDHELPSATRDYNITGVKYLVVKDERTSDPGNKWALSAKLSKLENGSGTQLGGAKLQFTSTAKDFVDVTGDGKTPPEANGAIKDQEDSQAVAPGAVVLTQGADADTEILADKATQSYQGYSAAELSLIKLNVLANSAQSGEYTGTVTWTLNSTPD